MTTEELNESLEELHKCISDDKTFLDLTKRVAIAINPLPERKIFPIRAALRFWNWLMSI